jgi:hypothetical protein
MIAHTYHPSSCKKYKIEGSQFRLAWVRSKTPMSKITRAKMTKGMAQAVEHRPYHCKTLSSNPRQKKKEKKKYEPGL